MALWADGISATKRQLLPEYNGAGLPVVAMSDEQK